MEEEITQVDSVPSVPTEHALTAGTLLGDIRLGQPVGTGLSSEVFSGENLITQRRCAVKVLRSELTPSRVAWGRFIHAAKRADSLDRKDVADVFNFGSTADGRRYVVQQWCEGQSLRQIVRQHAPLAQRSFLPLFRRLCEPLVAAHAAGLTHLRLHGGNVMVRWTEEHDPRVALLDFGVWLLHPPLGEDTALPRTAEHAIYIAPELAKGGPGDARSDVYALAVLLYEMVTGRVPFLASDFAGTLEQHINEPVLPPSEVTGVSREVDSAIVGGLQKEPGRRIPSVEALLSALDPLSAASKHSGASRRRIRALTTGELRDPSVDHSGAAERDAAQRSGAAVPPPLPADPLEPLPVVPRRRLALWVALAAVAVLCGGALLWALLDDAEPEEPTSESEWAPPAPTRARSAPVRRRPAPALRKREARAPAARPNPAPARASAPPVTVITPDAAPAPDARLLRRHSPALKARLRTGMQRRRVPLDRVKLARPPAKEGSYGTVTISTGSPRAQLYLDGRYVGMGDRRRLRRIPAGKHSLYIVVDGERSEEREVDVPAGGQISVDF